VDLADTGWLWQDNSSCHWYASGVSSTLEGLDAEGERARTELADALHALDARASRSVEPREEAAAKKAARSGA